MSGKISIKPRRVGPREARAMLRLNSDDTPPAEGFRNRPLNRANVARIAADIAAGKFHETGDTVKLTAKGEVLDGQHRLHAIIEAGKTLTLMVAENVPEDAMTAIDTGKARTFADLLAIEGRPNARAVAAAAKLIHHYENGTMLQSGRGVSHDTLQTLLGEHPFIHDAVARVKEERGLQPAAVFAFVYCMARERHPRKADAWISELVEMGYSSSATQVLARRLRNSEKAKEQLRSSYIAAMIVKSWNAYRHDERVESRDLEWRRGRGNEEEPFPVIA